MSLSAALRRRRAPALSLALDDRLRKIASGSLRAFASTALANQLDAHSLGAPPVVPAHQHESILSFSALPRKYRDGFSESNTYGAAQVSLQPVMRMHESPPAGGGPDANR